MARITVVLNDNLHEMLRKIQAKKISTATQNVSFSSVMNEAIAKGLGVEIDS